MTLRKLFMRSTLVIQHSIIILKMSIDTEGKLVGIYRIRDMETKYRHFQVGEFKP